MEGKKEGLLIGYPSIISYECSKKIIEQMENNICKIKVDQEQGTAFFCKIPFPDTNNLLPVFITNNHIINKNTLYKENQNIPIKTKSENNTKKICLNNRMKYTNEKYDITIIELKDTDEIKHYLELDDIIIKNIMNNQNNNIEYLDETMYIIQYPKGKLSVSYGILNNIYEDEGYNFNHKCETEPGSSGSPILNMNNKLIGIHKEGLYNNFNLGLFLNYPIKEFIQSYCNKFKTENKINKDNSNDKFYSIMKEFKFNNELKKVSNNSERKLKQSKIKIKLYDDIEYKIGNYYIKQTLRKVAFGEIRAGIYIPKNEKVSIKIIEKALLTEKDDKMKFKREFEVLSMLNHPNIIFISEILESEDSFYIVMEYNKKVLSNCLNDKKRLSEDESAFFYYQLIQGLEYIHSLGIVNNNLNIDNLILKKNNIIKLGDFSLCNYKGQKLLLPFDLCRSPFYVSPEIAENKNIYGVKYDIWSTGIILFYLLCGYPPFMDKNKDILFQKIIECKVEYPNFISDEAKDLMSRILVANPDKRITIEEIKKHNYYLKGKMIFDAEFEIKKINYSYQAVRKKEINFLNKKNNKNKKNEFEGKEKNIKNLDKKINQEQNLINNKSNLKNTKYKILPTELENITYHKEKLDNDKEINAKFNNFKNITIKKIDLNPNFKPKDRKFISRNGLLLGIIKEYSEIENVVNKIQDILLKQVTFNLVYKASDLGDNSKTFHKKCDKLVMSLVLIKTDKDLRFGGFTTQSWEGNNIKKIDNNAFVFNLETNSIYEIIKNEPAIWCYAKLGPVFLGCQIRIYDEFFIKGGTTCCKGLNYQTKNDYELNNGEEKYLIKDIEVYSIETIDE